MTSTSWAPSWTVISAPSSVILATVCGPPPWLGSNLRVGFPRRRRVKPGGFGLDEIDHGVRRFHAVGIGVVVVLQVLVSEAGQLVLIVIHVVEEVDGIAEGATRLNCFVRAGLDAEAAVHADAEVDLVADFLE